MGKGNCKACKNPGCAARGSSWTPNPAVECFGYEPRTNADKLRSIMDVKEMTDYLLWIYKNVLPMYTQSELGLEQWLKQEAQE